MQHIACEQAFCLGEGQKKLEGEGRERGRALRQTFEATIPPYCLLIADLLSARLSINVVSFACKKWVRRQHLTFTWCQMLLVPMSSFSGGRLCAGG